MCLSMFMRTHKLVIRLGCTVNQQTTRKTEMSNTFQKSYFFRKFRDHQQEFIDPFHESLCYQVSGS